MSFTEVIKYTIGFVMVVFVLAIGLRSCGDKAAVPLKEKEDPNAVTHYVGGYYIHEVHPKPGVTCFMHNSSISCIKE